MENQIKDLTGTEIMHHALLWCFNWTEEDFKQAFKDSKLGWEYQWNKLQLYIEAGDSPTAAVVGVVLAMDKPHLQMLFDFIFKEAAGQIMSAREWDAVIAASNNEEESE